MTQHPILDLDALASDLRLASGYAARAGLLRDPVMLERLKVAEQGLAAGGQPDMHALTRALNDVAQAILPMTLADLRSGRDPFEQSNQKWASRWHFFLAIAALITLLVIGNMMDSLRIEKAGLKAMEQMQKLQPTEKLVELYKIAQSYNDSLPKPNLTADLYRQKIAEYILMFQDRQLFDKRYFSARNTSLVTPPHDIIIAIKSWLMSGYSSADESENQRALPEKPEKDDGSKDNGSKGDGSKGDGSKGDGSWCDRDANGSLVLPWEHRQKPTYIKNQVEIRMEILCFQDQLLKPITGEEPYQEQQDVKRVGFMPDIESRMSRRSEWFLPFLFGCLGAIIFVMRNIASIRTPTMEFFPMIMRISLGGVAGIVMGWFSSAALPEFTSANALSVPFTLAFLTGYGIDALFRVLDRTSRGVASGAQHEKAS